jgi:hypothetical protein
VLSITAKQKKKDAEKKKDPAPEKMDVDEDKEKVSFARNFQRNVKFSVNGHLLSCWRPN